MTQKQKENIKHERVLKLKKIGFWTLNIVSYILATFFLIALIFSLTTPKKQNVSPRSVYKLYDNEITEVIREDIPNNVVYNDEEYKITLSVNELNNYSYDNLFTLLNTYTETDVVGTNIVYISNTYNLNELIPNDTLGYDYSTYNIIFYLDDVDNTKFSYNEGFDNLPFEDSIIWSLNSTIYEDVKTAIELDIQANESTINDSIFDSLANVLTNFITTLNSGVTSVIALFWDSANLQLTLLGNLTTIVIGVAVCFFLFRLVIGLIRLRG